MADPTERRRHLRTDARLAAGVRRPGEGDALAVTTLNIGAGGVYVEVPRFIEPLTKLEIALDLPEASGTTRVQADAIVVRTDPDAESPDVERYEVACAFLGLTDEDRAAIHRWVASRRSPTSPRV